MREIMPSLMATSLRWRKHSARTNYLLMAHNTIILQVSFKSWGIGHGVWGMSPNIKAGTAKVMCWTTLLHKRLRHFKTSYKLIFDKLPYFHPTSKKICIKFGVTQPPSSNFFSRSKIFSDPYIFWPKKFLEKKNFKKKFGSRKKI